MKGLKQIGSILLFILLTAMIFYGKSYLNDNFLLLNVKMRWIIDFFLLLLMGITAYFIVFGLSELQKKVFVIVVVLLNLFPIFFSNNFLFRLYGKYTMIFRAFLILAGCVIPLIIKTRTRGKGENPL